MQWGVVDYVLRGREATCFHLAEQLGLSAVELAEERVGDPQRLLFDPDRKDDLGRLSEETGVVASSVYALSFLRDSLVRGTEPDRRPALLALRLLAERAAQRGVGVVVLPLLGASSVETDAEATALTDLVARLSGWNDLPNVRFALKSLLPARELLGLLDSAARDRVGVSLDPGNILAARRDLANEIEMLWPRILHVHLKSRFLDGRPAPLGEGLLDPAALLGVLEEGRFAGPVILDLPPSRNGYESLKTAVQLCRRRAAA